MTKKLNVFLGSFIFIAWMVLLLAWMITGNVSWIIFWLLLAIFLFPFWWQIIVVFVGKEKIEEVANSSCSLMLILAAITLIVSAICILFYQLYGYLKTGTWVSISIIDGLLYFELDWAKNPTDWLGAWELLNHFPLSLSLIIAGALTFAVGEN